MIKAESGEVHMEISVKECPLYNFCIVRFQCLLMEFGEKGVRIWELHSESDIQQRQNWARVHPVHWTWRQGKFNQPRVDLGLFQHNRSSMRWYSRDGGKNLNKNPFWGRFILIRTVVPSMAELIPITKIPRCHLIPLQFLVDTPSEAISQSIWSISKQESPPQRCCPTFFYLRSPPYRKGQTACELCFPKAFSPFWEV